MDEQQIRELSLPLDRKPFRVRTEEAWASFLAGEKQLRALMDSKDRRAVSEQLTTLCAQLLSPAFAHPAFELGYNGEKYELILTPEGDRVLLFQLVYFQERAPRELLERWNILVGRSQSNDFGLRMYGQDVTLEDVQVWAEKTEDGGAGLKLYCGKLTASPQENYNILCILLDQALGELAAMRYVDYLDVLQESESGESIPLSRLSSYIQREIDPEGWPQAGDPALALQRYISYEGKPVEAEDFPLRRDVFAGVTRCVPLINSYYQGDDCYMDRLHQDGAVPGFFYYPLDGIDRKDVLDLRDKLEQSIQARTGEGVVTFTGGATGTSLGYLDFIAWDLKVLLDTAVEVLEDAPMEWAAFHTFRLSADGIGLK